MAVNHRKDSIQLIRDTEGINNKDRVRILSPGSSPPKETTEVTEHALYMEPKNTPADGEPYEYEFACCTGRRFIPQRAGDANKLEGKTSAEVKAMFADGRAVFAGSGTSVSLDAEGDRVHSITVNGFTTQAGTGDPSPENVRPIVVGGTTVNLFKQVINKRVGTINMITNRGVMVLNGTGSSSSAEADYVDAAFDLPAGKYSVSVIADKLTNGSEQPSFRIHHIDNSGSNILLGYVTWGKTVHEKTIDHPGGKIFFGIYTPRATFDNVTVKVMLVPGETADKNFIPTVNTKYGIGLIASGNAKSEIAAELTAPLCQGDTLITKVNSGCDVEVTFDGSEDEGWATETLSGNVIRYWIKLDSNIAQADSSNGFALSNWLTLAIPGGTSNALLKNVFTITGDQKLYVRTTNETLDEFKAKLKDNPLFVCCRTTSYTSKNDKDVALETHQRAMMVLDGTESFVMDDAGRLDLPGGLLYKPKTTACICTIAKPKYEYSGDGVFVQPTNNGLYFGTKYSGNNGFSTAAEFKAYLAAQYAAGTPVTIVYELATPLVYAHEPVDFEFVEGEDGVFTITGEADVTLDVYYKALQDGGDADKLGGKLPEYYAAAANALGQYTHTKSGTVHELTGTGDNIRFVATADFAAGDTVKVNGTTCTASTMSGDALWAGFFKSGAVVVCYRTGNALNFSGGGLAAAEAAKITPENLKTGVSVTVNGKTVAGTFTADGTAAAGDMLLGKTGYVKGQKVTGTIPSKAAASYKPGTSAQTIKAVQYLSGDQTIEGDAALIAANIKYGASIFDVDGSFTSDANAVAAEILTGKIGYVKGQKITGSMPNRGAVSQWLGINGTYTIPAGYHNGQGVVKQSITTKGEATYTPSTREQVIEKNQYLTGSQFIKGDSNLVAGNIRSGVSIFGVAGSFVEGSGGYLFMGQRNNTAMAGYAFGSASYSNGIRIGRSGNYRLVLFGYNETGDTGYLRVNGADVLSANLRTAAQQQTVKWLNAGDVVTIAATGGENYALTGFVYNT